MGIFAADEPLKGRLTREQSPCDETLPTLVADALAQAEPPPPQLLKKYQSIVGALMYCSTQTRPDVAFAVGMLARAMGKPTPQLYAAALRVLYYLDHHKHVGLRFQHDAAPMSGMSGM